MELQMKCSRGSLTRDMRLAIETLFHTYDDSVSEALLPQMFRKNNLLQHPLVWECNGKRYGIFCKKSSSQNSYYVFLARLKGDHGYTVEERYNIFRYKGSYTQTGEGCYGCCETCDGRAPILLFGEDGTLCFMFYSYKSRCSRMVACDNAERNMLMFDHNLGYKYRSVTQVGADECSYARLAV